MKKVVFVCTGNTCRSPMAAEIFKSFCLPFEVTSAGLFADGSPYCDKSVAALRETGVDLCGASRQLTRDDLAADIIFCMSDAHRNMLLQLGADDEKIKVLDISDPYGGDLDTYRRCRDEIKEKLSIYDFKIRRMDSGDIPSVAEIEKNCFSTPWSENALRDSLCAGTVFFVCENAEGVVGYAGMQVTLDEAYVTNIAVLPQYQGLGLGTRLTDTLLSYGEEEGLSFVSLEVRESNKRAISVYGKAGFALAGKRKNFYSAPKEDALIMTRVIKSEDTQH